MKICIEHPALPKGVTLRYEDLDLEEMGSGELQEMIDDHVYAIRVGLRPTWLNRIYAFFGL